ncbi:MAG TPA: hypothetical protein VKR61_17815 [Bryobacteraceae bacterium]|nr:hypothetical protein [Bryobacteraceae bacterium]
MTDLLDRPPYSPRDDTAFLAEMQRLTQHHLNGCRAYAKIWRDWNRADAVDELPFLHVGLFKRLEFRTEGTGITHERTLLSSSTTGAQPSQIALDSLSSRLQARSALAILKDMVGEGKRPLLILDDARALRQRGVVSARLAAAMSLSPLATGIHFLLNDASDPASMKWEVLAGLLESAERFLVYGFSSNLWLAWGAVDMPTHVRALLRGKVIHFVHSGGWKKMEALRVGPVEFDGALTRDLDPASRVVDYYGLVEQVGVIYPLCEQGARHVPVWADVLVRDPYTMGAVEDQPGQIQSMNVLAYGAPYHSVLSEDMGRIVPGDCPCGRQGKRFELLGRMPEAELRGCANV